VRQLGQDVRGVDQHVFHHLAHARAHLEHEHAQHEERRQPADQEEAEQQAQAEFHALGPDAGDRRADRRDSRARGG
jgi:hypothetical protein